MVFWLVFQNVKKNVAFILSTAESHLHVNNKNNYNDHLIDAVSKMTSRYRVQCWSRRSWDLECVHVRDDGNVEDFNSVSGLEVLSKKG